MMEEFEALQAIYGEDISITLGNPSFIRFVLDQCNSVQFEIPDGFPNTKPNVRVLSNHSGSNALEQLLQDSLASKSEPGYLFENIEIARQWLEENKEDPEKDFGKNDAAKEASICKFYLENKCRFGDRCSFKHATAKNMENSDALSETDGGMAKSDCVSDLKNDKQCQRNKTQCQASKSVNHEEEKFGSKKLPMKTAIDVINRIIWDDEFPTEDFIVGYLDRFIGIVEKAFNSFSWEDIASVDYSTLAIPKHRIQYFKYKDVVIWDKRTRVDKVFGSTGSTEQIQDIIKSHQQNGPEASKGPKNENTDGELEHEDYTEDVEDYGDDEEHDVTRKKWKEKDRPNFFFCFRITNNDVKEKIKQVQCDIVACEEILQEACLKQTEFHVTLCMLRLNNNEEKATALKVLEAIQPILVCMLPRTRSLLLEKIGNFRGRVLHVEVSCDAVLSKFVEILMLKLKDAGLNTCCNREPYCPHVTIIKLSRPMCRTMNSSQINQSYYMPYCNDHFGDQAIERIQLCSTSKQRDESGFYVELASKSNSLLCISEKIANIVSSYVNELTNQSIVSEEEGDRIVEAVLNKDEDDFEAAVIELEQILDQRNPHLDSNRIVVILRGLPGSGKSHLVNESMEMRQSQSEANQQIVVCGADEYFENSQSGYNYSSSELAAAHAYCREKFVSAIESNINCIVIDNTNSKVWEYQIYKRIAKLGGYRVHKLEISCKDEETLRCFVERSQHKVDKAVVTRMWERWESDKESVVIEPRFKGSSDKIDLLDFLHKDSTEPSQVIHAKGVLFSALYLDPDSKRNLLNMFPAVHSKVTASHMTLTYKPMKEEIPHIPVGKKHSLAVVGYVCTDVLQAVAVSEVGEPLCGAEIPHVTISHSKKAAPKHAKNALENIQSWKKPENELTLSGVIGVQVAVSEKKSLVVTDPDKFHGILGQDDNSVSARANTGSKDAIGSARPMVNPTIYIGSEIITSLFVFDFDGTLFHTPDPALGRQQYRDLTGEKWPHKGWISRQESLQFPLRSRPGPSFTDFKEHLGRAGSLTVLLTARLKCTSDGVEEVLREYGIHPQEAFLKPYTELKDDYKTNRAPNFKADVVKELLKSYPDVNHVKIWDDRQDNIDMFRRMKKSHSRIQFELFKVGDETPSKTDAAGCKDISKIVDAFGFGRFQDFNANATEGINFIVNAWSTCLGMNMEACLKLAMPFGSFPLKRIGDVDLCLLAPSHLKQDECIVKLEAELSKRGIRHVHCATGIRCPRLKVCLLFENAAPIDFDIVFAPCLQDLKNPKINTGELYRNGSKGVKSALEGILFLEHVNSCIKDKITLEDFGILVDLIVLYLKTKHMKGNAFHCIRTFHIVRALAEMFGKIKVSSENIIDNFKSSLHFLSKLDLAYWKRICKDCVPEEILSRIITSFKDAVRMMSESESVWTIFALVKFPPENYTVASITVKSHVSELQWRASTLLEARIGTCIRKLISSGVDVVPGPSDYSNTVQFAIPQCEWNIMLCKDALKSLQSEAMFFDNKDNLDVIINVQ